MTYIHVQTLKDLAACSVAKHFDCNDLLTTISTLKSPLDGHMLQRICRYAFPEAEEKFKSFLVTIIGLKSWTLSEAGALLDNDSVRESLQVGFLLVARVADSNLGQSVDSGANVVIKSEKQTIVSASCSLCTEGPWCKHTLAAVLYRMRYPEKVPVHAPLTEILSSLSRNQLERLLHITIKNTNGAIIMPLWRTIEELEDQHSEINLSRGVPDPTFEESEETEVFWNQALSIMKENLHETAQFGEKGLRYSDGGCEESEFDFRAKPKAWYLSYLRKIKNLLHIGEIEKAGSALAALASSSYHGYESMAIGNAAASRLRYFCDELQIWCACFILSFDGKGREVLKDTVSALHSSSRTSKFVREMKSTSLFTDLHSIEIPLQRGRSVDFQQPLSEAPEPPPPCLFLNAVRAYDIKVVHPDVADIEVNEEPLSIMMYRFESLVLFCPGRSDRVLWKYGIILIRRLLHSSAKFSVLNEIDIKDMDIKDANCDSNEDGPSPSKIRRENTSTTPNEQWGNTGHITAYSLAGNNTYCAEGCTPTVSSHHHGIYKHLQTDISVEQLAYAFLYVCHKMFNTNEFKTGSSQVEGFEILMEASYRAKHLAESYAAAFLKQDSSVKICSYRLANVLATTEDLPVRMRAQLCGNIVCSALTIAPTHKMTTDQIPIAEIMTNQLLKLHFGTDESKPDSSIVITKVLEECIRSDSAEVSYAVFEVFRSHASYLNCSHHNRLMMNILLKYGLDPNKNSPRKQQGMCESLLEFGRKIGNDFPNIATQNWDKIAQYFNHCYLLFIFNSLPEIR